MKALLSKREIQIVKSVQQKDIDRLGTGVLRRCKKILPAGETN
jgi:hypothetical protein